MSLAIALAAVPVFAAAGMGEAALSSALYCVLLVGFVGLRRPRER